GGARRAVRDGQPGRVRACRYVGVRRVLARRRGASVTEVPGVAVRRGATGGRACEGDGEGRLSSGGASAGGGGQGRGAGAPETVGHRRRRAVVGVQFRQAPRGLDGLQIGVVVVTHRRRIVGLDPGADRDERDLV